MDNDSAPVKLRAGVWHHQILSRLKAEELLVEAQVDGAFLIRDSETIQNAHVLGLLHQGRVHHFRILRDEHGKLHMKALPGVHVQYFDRLDHMVTFYSQPDRGLPCELHVPVAPADPELPDDESEDDDEEEEQEEEEEEDVVDGASCGIYDTLPLMEKAAEIGTDSVDNTFHSILSPYLGGAIQVDLDAVSSGNTNLEELQKLIASSSHELTKHLKQFLSRIMLLKKVFSVGGESDKMSFSLPQSSEDMSDYEQLLDMMARGIAGCKSLQAQASRALKDLANLTPPVEDYIHEKEAKSRSFEVLTQGMATANFKNKMCLTVDVHAGKISFLKSLNDTPDVNNTHEQSKVVQLIKSRTHIKRLGIKLDSKPLKEFEFDDGKSREVFCQIVQQMKNQHSPCETVKNITIFIGTWNMGDANPPADIRSWYKCQGKGKSRDITLAKFPHAIYAIGTQECSMSEKDWVARIKADLKNMFDEEFKVVDVCTLWSIRLVVLVKQSYEHLISHRQISSVKTGIANRLGNKGAAAVSFMFGATSLCFINCHLAARGERVLRRNQNYHDILKGLNFGQKSIFDITHQFHHVLWFGDLNYRIVDLSIEEIKESLRADNLSKLKVKDQLKDEQERGTVFFQFAEEAITFPPTYRFKRECTGPHDYVFVKTKRAGNVTNLPSWCDRVLWHSFPETSLMPTSYGCVTNVRTSDHWPVFSTFDMKVISQYVSSPDLGRIEEKPDQGGCKINFDIIEAEIKTNSKTQFIIEFHSGCLEAIKKSVPNSTTDWHHKGRFERDRPKNDTAASVHRFSYPSWSKSVLPTLHPIISDREYIEDQYLLLAVRSVDGDESYGECCISLKVMIAETMQKFDAFLTHFGEETGQIRGEMHVLLPRDNDQSASVHSQDLIREADLDEVSKVVPAKSPRPIAKQRSVKLERHSALIPSERRSPSPRNGLHSNLPGRQRPVSQPEPASSIQSRELPPLPSAKPTQQPATRPQAPPPLPVKPGNLPCGGGQCKEQAWFRGEPNMAGINVSQPEPASSIQSRELPPLPSAKPTQQPATRPQAPPPLPVKKPVKPQTVEEMMQKIGFPQYTNNLTENGWDDIEFLQDLTEDDLEEAKVPKECRTTILAAAKKFAS